MLFFLTIVSNTSVRSLLHLNQLLLPQAILTLGISPWTTLDTISCLWQPETAPVQAQLEVSALVMVQTALLHLQIASTGNQPQVPTPAVTLTHRTRSSKPLCLCHRCRLMRITLRLLRARCNFNMLNSRDMHRTTPQRIALLGHLSTINTPIALSLRMRRVLRRILPQDHQLK